jgi:hypothetical protein
MLPQTREQIDELFQQFQDDNFVRRHKSNAADLYRVARDSEQFKAITGGFLSQILQSITVMGVTPEPLGKMVLLMLSMGAEYQGVAAIDAPKPPDKIRELANTLCSIAVLARVEATEPEWKSRWESALAELNVAVMEGMI